MGLAAIPRSNSCILNMTNPLAVSKKTLEELLPEFSKLYWLKPVDVPWEVVTASIVRDWIEIDSDLLDLGCGDGLFTSIMLGGVVADAYDRFQNIEATYQTIGVNQSGDIFKNQVPARLSQAPIRLVNYGLDLKERHLRVAGSTGTYRELLQGSFESIPLPDDCIDQVISIFAFYWGDELAEQFVEVKRVLRSKGEILVVLPSEHLYHLHLCNQIAGLEYISDNLRNFAVEMDGGRASFVSRHGRDLESWSKFVAAHGLEVVDSVPIINDKMFVIQDFAQRVFLPTLSSDTVHSKLSKQRKTVQSVLEPFIDQLIQEEMDITGPHGYYLLRIVKP